MPPTGIAINKTTNVLVSGHGSTFIFEYTTTGKNVRQFNIQPVGIVNPWLAIPLPNDHYVVSSDQGINVVNPNGSIVHTYKGSVGLGKPTGLVLVESGDILVADQGTNKLLVLDSSLSSARELLLPEGVTLQNPRALFLDSTRGRLYVGEWNGDRVLVLDNVFNEGNYVLFNCKLG